VWAEVPFSAPHLPHNGLFDSSIRWRCLLRVFCPVKRQVDSSWNVMAHCDTREGKWRGNWRMQCLAITLHTTSEHGVCSITTADAHTSAVSSRLNRSPRRFKWTRPFRRKTKSDFCACAITFQLASNNPGLCPVEGQKPRVGTRAESRN